MIFPSTVDPSVEIEKRLRAGASTQRSPREWTGIGNWKLINDSCNWLTLTFQRFFCSCYCPAELSQSNCVLKIITWTAIEAAEAWEILLAKCLFYLKEREKEWQEKKKKKPYELKGSFSETMWRTKGGDNWNWEVYGSLFLSGLCWRFHTCLWCFQGDRIPHCCRPQFVSLLLLQSQHDWLF